MSNPSKLHRPLSGQWPLRLAMDEKPAAASPVTGQPAAGKARGRRAAAVVDP